MDYIKVIGASALSALALFLIAKIIGHKQMSQLDFFDYIVGITIGSIAAELATELATPLHPLIALVVYGGISYLLSLLSRKIIRSRKYINGTPTILLHGGRLYRENLKKAKLELSEFLVLCREQGYFDLSDIQTAVFEYNGKLSILPTATSRPLTPEDMKLSPASDGISTEIIMDGQVMSDNLKRLGLEEIWLTRQLSAQGYSSPKEVLLALCDNQNTLTLFPMS